MVMRADFLKKNLNNLMNIFGGVGTDSYKIESTD